MLKKQREDLRNRSKGFTIIELLVVIVVIGILVALLLPNLFSAQQRGRDADRKNDVKTIQQQLEAYYNDNNHYPGDTATLVPDYMEEVPTDPNTGNAYVYEPKDDAGADCSAAPDTCVKYKLAADLENDNDADAETFNTEAGWYVLDSVNQ